MIWNGKAEILGKPPLIPADLLIETFRRHTVQGRQVGIEEHALSAHDTDLRCDVRCKRTAFRTCHEAEPAPHPAQAHAGYPGFSLRLGSKGTAALAHRPVREDRVTFRCRSG